MAKRVLEDVVLDLPDLKVSVAQVLADISETKITLIGVSFYLPSYQGNGMYCSVDVLPALTLEAQQKIKAFLRFKYKVRDNPEWPPVHLEDTLA